MIFGAPSARAQVPRGANQPKTENDLRQLGMAATSYATEHDGSLPDTLEDLKPYLGGDSAYKEILRNPRSNDEIGYIYVKPAAKLNAVKDPQKTPMFYESIIRKKDESGMICYVDGHVAKGAGAGKEVATKEDPKEAPKGAAASTPVLSSGEKSSTPQPLGADLDFLPPPAPWQAEKSPNPDKAVYTWAAGGRSIIPNITLIVAPPPPADAADVAAQIAERVRAHSPSDREMVVAPEIIADQRFVSKVHYCYRKESVLVDTMIIQRRVGTRMVTIGLTADGDIATANRGKAIGQLLEEIAMSVVPHGKAPGAPIVFDGKSLLPRDVQDDSETGFKRSIGLDTTGLPPVEAKLVDAKAKPTPAVAIETPREAPKPDAVKTPATPAKPDAPPAGALDAARKQKNDNPAEAYAAFKAIVTASPGSSDARAAKLEMAMMEIDATASKKIMASETKAYPALNMAQNFQNSGQLEKAKQRYEQVIKEYPDTLCASLAKKKLEEVNKAASEKQ